MSRKFFRWDGAYIAFERVGRLFRPDGSYLGWIDQDWATVWGADGTYLGEIVDDAYILRNTLKVPPIPRVPRMQPVPPIPPIRPLNRVPRVGRAGWRDAV